MDVLQEIHKLFDNLDNMSERYNFTWNGKAKAYFESAIPSTKTLKPQIEESVNFDVSENLFITGDNLETLKLLQESYLEKLILFILILHIIQVKILYIMIILKIKKESDIEEGKIDSEGNRLIKMKNLVVTIILIG